MERPSMITISGPPVQNEKEESTEAKKQAAAGGAETLSMAALVQKENENKEASLKSVFEALSALNAARSALNGGPIEAKNAEEEALMERVGISCPKTNNDYQEDVTIDLRVQHDQLILLRGALRGHLMNLKRAAEDATKSEANEKLSALVEGQLDRFREELQNKEAREVDRLRSVYSAVMADYCPNPAAPLPVHRDSCPLSPHRNLRHRHPPAPPRLHPHCNSPHTHAQRPNPTHTHTRCNHHSPPIHSPKRKLTASPRCKHPTCASHRAISPEYYLPPIYDERNQKIRFAHNMPPHVPCARPDPDAVSCCRPAPAAAHPSSSCSCCFQQHCCCKNLSAISPLCVDPCDPLWEPQAEDYLQKRYGRSQKADVLEAVLNYSGGFDSLHSILGARQLCNFHPERGRVKILHSQTDLRRGGGRPSKRVPVPVAAQRGVSRDDLKRERRARERDQKLRHCPRPPSPPSVASSPSSSSSSSASPVMKKGSRRALSHSHGAATSASRALSRLPAQKSEEDLARDDAREYLSWLSERVEIAPPPPASRHHRSSRDTGPPVSRKSSRLPPLSGSPLRFAARTEAGGSSTRGGGARTRSRAAVSEPSRFSSPLRARQREKESERKEERCDFRSTGEFLHRWGEAYFSGRQLSTSTRSGGGGASDGSSAASAARLSGERFRVGPGMQKAGFQKERCRVLEDLLRDAEREEPGRGGLGDSMDRLELQLRGGGKGPGQPQSISMSQIKEMQREENKAKALAFHQAGNYAEARKYFTRAIEVTALMMAEVLSALRSELSGVLVVVAPYEADAQLAHMAMSGFVDVVVSEDSDLMAFGCPKVLYKVDDIGGCCELELTQVLGLRSQTLPLYKLSKHEDFILMCVLAGCDYLDSVKGVGVKKAAKAVINGRGEISKVIRQLRIDGLTVPRDYEANVRRAVESFLFQTVFDCREQAWTHLRPLPESLVGDDVDRTHLGEFKDEPVASQIVQGLIVPFSLTPYADILRENGGGSASSSGGRTAMPPPASLPPQRGMGGGEFGLNSGLGGVQKERGGLLTNNATRVVSQSIPSRLPLGARAKAKPKPAVSNSSKALMSSFISRGLRQKAQEGDSGEGAQNLGVRGPLGGRPFSTANRGGVLLSHRDRGRDPQPLKGLVRPEEVAAARVGATSSAFFRPFQSHKGNQTEALRGVEGAGHKLGGKSAESFSSFGFKQADTGRERGLEQDPRFGRSGVLREEEKGMGRQLGRGEGGPAMSSFDFEGFAASSGGGGPGKDTESANVHVPPRRVIGGPPNEFSRNPFRAAAPAAAGGDGGGGGLGGRNLNPFRKENKAAAAAVPRLSNRGASPSPSPPVSGAGGAVFDGFRFGPSATNGGVADRIMRGDGGSGGFRDGLVNSTASSSASRLIGQQAVRQGVERGGGAERWAGAPRDPPLVLHLGHRSGGFGHERDGVSPSGSGTADLDPFGYGQRAPACPSGEWRGPGQDSPTHLLFPSESHEDPGSGDGLMGMEDDLGEREKEEEAFVLMRNPPREREYGEHAERERPGQAPGPRILFPEAEEDGESGGDCYEGGSPAASGGMEGLMLSESQGLMEGQGPEEGQSVSPLILHRPPAVHAVVSPARAVVTRGRMTPPASHVTSVVEVSPLDEAQRRPVFVRGDPRGEAGVMQSSSGLGGSHLFGEGVDVDGEVDLMQEGRGEFGGEEEERRESDSFVLHIPRQCLSESMEVPRPVEHQSSPRSLLRRPPPAFLSSGVRGSLASFLSERETEGEEGGQVEPHLCSSNRMRPGGEGGEADEEQIAMGVWEEEAQVSPLNHTLAFGGSAGDGVSPAYLDGDIEEEELEGMGEEVEEKENQPQQQQQQQQQQHRQPSRGSKRGLANVFSSFRSDTLNNDLSFAALPPPPSSGGGGEDSAALRVCKERARQLAQAHRQKTASSSASASLDGVSSALEAFKRDCQRREEGNGKGGRKDQKSQQRGAGDGGKSAAADSKKAKPGPSCAGGTNPAENGKIGKDRVSEEKEQEKENGEHKDKHPTHVPPTPKERPQKTRTSFSQKERDGKEKDIQPSAGSDEQVPPPTGRLRGRGREGEVVGEKERRCSPRESVKRKREERWAREAEREKESDDRGGGLSAAHGEEKENRASNAIPPVLVPSSSDFESFAFGKDKEKDKKAAVEGPGGENRLEPAAKRRKDRMETGQLMDKLKRKVVTNTAKPNKTNLKSRGGK
uniref:Exonuclease 1 n=1 Tax=Chromera velia CCMP2878 TaxID=1169474 RepID=A0A0G4G0C6_9ALVE|eukprot:Cvel_3989.t1-p1 / transcript=Cvel_3989.t1 / gene=Cvel_3989 / organism=Chromera_velia_CCMP2878 / gene_product=Exonuclease 1, putative / transcript_product=Exonuclease 1, putative / location=Cvel_scaffold169:73646-89394(-) / protein_length=2201 / sequence_SO=supercontig / SO=protein_coding / is_pseudo=false